MARLPGAVDIVGHLWATPEQGMGAYSMCIASEFNGIPRPKTYYVITGTDKYDLHILVWGQPSCRSFVMDLLRRHVQRT
jgi:hypothetical protein